MAIKTVVLEIPEAYNPVKLDAFEPQPSKNNVLEVSEAKAMKIIVLEISEGPSPVRINASGISQ